MRELSEELGYGLIFPTICRYCGEMIYLYASPYGGFAIVDALGKPWPKHVCSGIGVTSRTYDAECMRPSPAYQLPVPDVTDWKSVRNGQQLTGVIVYVRDDGFVEVFDGNYLYLVALSKPAPLGAMITGVVNVFDGNETLNASVVGDPTKEEVRSLNSRIKTPRGSAERPRAEEKEMSRLFNDDQRIALIDDEIAYVLRQSQPQLEDRLAAVFRCAWALLPEVAVREIVRHWQDKRRFVERIVIKDLGFSNDGDPILGVTLLSGHRIEFDSRAVKCLPEKLLAGLIVHELGHVYAYAIGDGLHKSDYGSEEEQGLAEPVVDALLTSWGLSDYDEETSQWIAKNREGWALD